MKSSKLKFAIIPVLFAVLLSSNMEALNARDADLASRTFAAAQTAKQQCINTCRARYRDCRRLNQLPSFECRGVYQDCTRYSLYWFRTRMTDAPFAAVGEPAAAVASGRNSNSHVQMMKSAEKWRRQNATNGMYCSRRRRVLVDRKVRASLVIVGRVRSQQWRRCRSPYTTTWSRHSRRIEPIALSQYPFCHGDRGAVGRP